ncbi:hypothetical protein ASPZODRAFT_137156 [Penicilliopsis zonata CBS 506.65]|uniref:Threonine/serine exporter-like N-terminal domain-containing protein n=1 Tax=Penicilliopsis zonata CBS 506.65 TaxID=1073090 RepID=A0A1L9S5S7_9EURO|nr:hypothetical protein ASPZODRAFT_137156 [Penicilliopsis zonata CBS 506.65]OJJ42518.1 hypothetical protein ASPZODRAFT_137156 [Penicilliopsis zonata CBS 506.65]
MSSPEGFPLLDLRPTDSGRTEEEPAVEPPPPSPDRERPRNPNRVRFHSIHHTTTRTPGEDDEPPRDFFPPHSLHALNASTDMTDLPLNDRSPFVGQPGPAEKTPQLVEEDKPQDRGDGDKTNRFKAAGQVLRQKTVRLTERLGRPADEGEALMPTSSTTTTATDTPPRRPFYRRQHSDGADSTRSLIDGASSEAHRLVRSFGWSAEPVRLRKPRKPYLRSGFSTPDGQTTPTDTAPAGGGYSHVRMSSGGGGGGGGILSQLLRLQASQQSSRDSDYYSSDDESLRGSSGTATPVAPGAITPGGTMTGYSTPKKEKIKWYKKSHHRSTSSLVEASMNLSRASLPATADLMPASTPQQQHHGKRSSRRKNRLEEEIRVTVHIAEILARQRYIMQLCRALMRYGAPTHRLEEYMVMTARVLEVDGQFLYLPGCMIMSFDDAATRTAEVKLVRVGQGVDLGRLAESHNVYKNVVHDLIGVEEAIQDLDDIMKRKPRYNRWLLVGMYGFASAAVGPFAFGARPIDMPIIFILGCLVGFMQHVLAPASVLYSNVFEVTAAVLTSFLARAFGSIYRPGTDERLFCFSALAQSSIALILPGFLVLCSSLELQSHQIIAGSIRMVYAIIYSLFLGYGITVGLTIYGLMDGSATSQQTCTNSSAAYGNEYLERFPFVAIYCVFLALINQAKWKQIPAMVLIAVPGYIANYFSTKRLGSSSEVANTVGAFTIGVLGNLYSRIWHGHAATAILPGIFVLVPSGLASSGSLIAGLEYANAVKNDSASSSTSTSSSTSVASLGFGMIQVAIGITVGLFMAALIVYPYGKRRSGLFSF